MHFQKSAQRLNCCRLKIKKKFFLPIYHTDESWQRKRLFKKKIVIICIVIYIDIGGETLCCNFVHFNANFEVTDWFIVVGKNDERIKEK